MSLILNTDNSLGYNREQLIEAFGRFSSYGNPFGGDAGLNGHFWCVRPDGTIWDNSDLGQNECRKGLKIRNRKIDYYVCENAITNAIMAKKIKDCIKSLTGDYETSLTLLDECYGDDFGKLTCMFNATVRAKRCGGKIAFGSIGLKTDDKRFTAWLSGDKTFSTFADFTKGDNIGRLTPN